VTYKNPKIIDCYGYFKTATRKKPFLLLQKGKIFLVSAGSFMKNLPTIAFSKSYAIACFFLHNNLLPKTTQFLKPPKLPFYIFN